MIIIAKRVITDYSDSIRPGWAILVRSFQSLVVKFSSNILLYIKDPHQNLALPSIVNNLLEHP